MSKIEKRLCILAIVFVVVYLVAAALTLHNRFSAREDAQPRIESMAPTKAESRLTMAELFPPMIVLLAIAVSYVIVKKKRARQIVALEKSEDDIEESENQTHPPVQE